VAAAWGPCHSSTLGYLPQAYKWSKGRSGELLRSVLADHPQPTSKVPGPVATSTRRWRTPRPGPHYARVGVTVEPRTQRTVHISPNAFSWLREAYGDKAREGPGLAKYKQQEALDGATFALIEAGVGGEVTVIEISCSNADTAPGDVRFAATYAVWNALNDEAHRAPWIDDGGVHFPDVGGRTI
jgi:hypothetical protein